ncbi:hypothetical protein BDZ97DRAFT_1650330 [Flammula alnicola]|nr:hypothetical protein BDZ97DRAFT_1650330 [Flammula alnicola]
MASSQALPSGVPRTASGKPIPCSPKNTKLNPATHKLISECVETTFCWAPPGSPPKAVGLGVCLPRLCRRDEFPFGYGLKANDTTVELPPMCSKGMFCPDNGSGCRLQVKMGEKCELARDEQCEAPPSDPNIKGGENKSVCLNMICTPATLPLNAPCSIENTTYVSDINRGAAGGGQYITAVIKHNCLSPGLFCDPTPPDLNASGPTCQQTKKLGQKCRFDAECELQNCLSPSNTCGMPPETPLRIAPWNWVATVLFIILSMTSAFLVLLFMHKRRRYKRYQELQEYYHEQISLRRSILALHAAAAEQLSLTKTVHEKASGKERGR